MTDQTIEHLGFTIVIDDAGLRIRNPYGVTVCYMGGTAKGIPLAKTIIDNMVNPPHRTRRPRRQARNS